MSGAWELEWLFPVWCSLINWWSCKILQITPSSQKLVSSSALVYPTYVCPLSTSFTVCVRPAECTTHYCCGLFLWFLCNFVSWPHELTLVVSGRGHQHYILAPSGCHITMSVCQSVAQICLEHSISDLQIDIDFQSNIITIQWEPITLLSLVLELRIVDWVPLMSVWPCTAPEHSLAGTDIATYIGDQAPAPGPHCRPGEWAASPGVKMLKSCTNILGLGAA